MRWLHPVILTVFLLFQTPYCANALVKKNEPGHFNSFVGSALDNTRRILKGEQKLRHAKVVASDKKYQSSTDDLYSSFVVPLLAGGAATAFGDLIVHPLDTIKTVQQASTAGSAKSTFVGAIKGIIHDFGPFGFYKGVGPFVLLDGLAGCVKFAAYEAFKKVASDNSPESLRPYSHFAAAAFAFLACSFVLVPGELVKQNLQAGTYPSLLDALTGIARSSGPRGFFKGWGATLVRDVPYTILELGFYDSAKRLIRRIARPRRAEAGGEAAAAAAGGGPAEGEGDLARYDLVAAAAVGAFVGYVTNPLDIIKTRLMTGTFAPGSARPGLTRILVDMWRKEGPGSLMAGAVVRAAWLLPYTAIYLPAYDAAKRWLRRPAPAPRA